MGNSTPASSIEMAVLVIGLLTMLYGTFMIWKKRGMPGPLIVWGSLIDLGLALIGLGLGLAGEVGGILIIGYQGIARVAAWFGLSRLVSNPWRCTADDIRSIVYRKPVPAILMSFALVASLGISPFFTPDGQHYVFSAIAQSTNGIFSGPFLTVVLAFAYTVMLWLYGEVLLQTCFTTPAEAAAIRKNKGLAALEEESESPVIIGWGTDCKYKSLYGLILALVVLGLARSFVQDFFCWFFDIAAGDILDMENGSWSLSAKILYFGSFLVICPRIIKAEWRATYSTGLLLLSFLLTMIAPIPATARLFGLIITGIGFLVGCYSIGYIEENERKAWYWFLLLMTFGSLDGIVTSNNISIFGNLWEVMTWASFFLVAWEMTDRARKAALKYLIICCSAAYFMIIGLMMIGGTEASYTGIMSNIAGCSGSMLRFGILFALFGFMAKAGLVPLHSWLPDAHPAAPSSISAPLSGVLTKMGVFGIVIVFYMIVNQNSLQSLGTFEGMSAAGVLVTLVGIITMGYGEISALYQTDIKRMLAYSTMGQVGEIVTVLGIGTWLSLTGSLTHVLNHAIMKDLLFLCAGALIMRAGSRELKDLAGIGRLMPWTVTCMVIGIISIMGLPPFNGFISKYIMIVACMDAGHPLIAASLIIASLVGAVYYMRILRTLVFEPAPVGKYYLPEAPVSMRVAMTILAGLCVLLGICPQLGLSIVTPVADMLAGTTPNGIWGISGLPDLIVTWPIYVVVPLIGAIVPVLLKGNPRKAGFGTAIVLALSAVLTLIFGRDLDMISLCMAFIVPAMGAVNMFYAVEYLAHSHSQWRFYTFFTLMCAGLAGVAASPDLFSFFMFWEIMSSWSLYFAIAHEGTVDALREAFKYFLFNIAGAGCLFLAIGLLLACTGTSRFDLLLPLIQELPNGVGTAIFALLVLGFLMKAAQLSLRIDWQMHPDLAPTPVSGYISSVLLKIAVFGMVKVFVMFGGIEVFAVVRDLPFHMETIMYIAAWIGAFTILYSALQAMIQVRLKLVFIWSTVSQIGYMVLGVACGTALGMTGGLLHLANHIFFKDLLFLMVGAVMVRTGMDSIYELGGLGRQMPKTMFCFFIGALAVVGVPPTSGFTSKWIIYQALVEAGEPLLAVISLIGSVITLAYMARFLHIVFLGRPSRDFSKISDPSCVMLIPMMTLATLTVLSGVFPGLFLAPIVDGLAEFGMQPLDVNLAGLSTGIGAWDATTATLLILVTVAVVYGVTCCIMKHAKIREDATTHACGHDADVATTPMPPDSVFNPLVEVLTAHNPQGRDFILRELCRCVLEHFRPRIAAARQKAASESQIATRSGERSPC